MEKEEGNSDLPSPGHVKSLVSRIEKEACNVRQSDVLSLKNGTPILPVKSVPTLVVDNTNEDKNPVNHVGPESEKSDASPSDESLGLFRLIPWLGSNRNKNKERLRRSSQFYSSASESDNYDVSPRSEAERPEKLPKEGGNERRVENACGKTLESALFTSDVYSIDSGEGSVLAPKSACEKSFLVVKELYSTEENYVNTLRLLNVDFRNFIEEKNFQSKTKVIPEMDLKKILDELRELQSLNENLLADFKLRLENWDSSPKIADVIVKKGHFLKIYSTYIQKFESQQNFFEECCSKYVKFGKMVEIFEAMDKCGKLTLKQHMLRPVQRLPQFRLLLENYVKALCITSPDYDDAVTALRIVTNVAEHLNNSMKHADKVGRMVQLQSMLSDFQLIEPGRELIKDGPLQKVCRKSPKDRYFILLNDCLLYTTPSTTYLKFHQTLPFVGMKVKYNKDDTNMFTFAVYSTTKSFILCAKSEAERRDWVEALNRAINDYIHKSVSVQFTHTYNEKFELGNEAPVWIPDGKVTMCQLCIEEFTQWFRRHHCRACGKVVCWSCSNNLAPLKYKAYKAQRVCDPCFEKLLQDFEDHEDDIKAGLQGDDEDLIQNAYLTLKGKFVRSNNVEGGKLKKYVPTRLKEVSAKDADADMSGWLRYWKSHKWKVDKNWYVLKDRVLYVYRASEDVVASKSISVLGYRVEYGTKENLDNVDSTHIFQLTHPQQPPMIFSADTVEAAERWVQVLTAASNFDDLLSLD